MSFRVKSIALDNIMFSNKRIKLINTEFDKSKNHYTLLLGNNGTGKSTILGEIARNVSSASKPKLDLFAELHNKPERTIVISNSPFDKFPMDRSYNTKYYSRNNYLYNEMDYFYIGYRGHNISKTNRINKVIEVLLNNYGIVSFNQDIRQILTFLGYNSRLNIIFRIKVFESIFKDARQLAFMDGNIIEMIPDRYLEDAKNFGISAKEYFSLKEDKKFRSGDYHFSLDYECDNADIVDDYKFLRFLMKIDRAYLKSVYLTKIDNTKVDILNASSGEGNIILSLLPLIPLLRDDSLVLIDEPEISLHPEWQSRFMSILDNLFSRVSGCHCIISSHSHFLVSDLPLDCSTIVSLRKNENKIESVLYDRSTYGLSAEDVLLNVFNLPTSRNFALSTRLTNILEQIGMNSMDQERFNEELTFLNKVYDKIKVDDPLRPVVYVIKEKLNEGFDYERI